MKLKQSLPATQAKKLRIKASYEAGRDSKAAIAREYDISRTYLYRLARLGGWEYQKELQTVTADIEKKTFEKIAEEESDRAAGLAKGFFNDVEKQKKLINAVLSDYVKTLTEQGGRMSKADASRIFESMKINKITMETLMIGFTGAMKAMGLYKDIIDHQSSDGSVTSTVHINVRTPAEIAEEVLKITGKINGGDI